MLVGVAQGATSILQVHDLCIAGTMQSYYAQITQANMAERSWETL